MECFINVVFVDGSNPYICTTFKRLFNIACKYYVDIVNGTVYAFSRRNCEPNYHGKKEILREFAILWFSGNNIQSWFDVACITRFFTVYGRRFGLINEFRENAII